MERWRDDKWGGRCDHCHACCQLRREWRVFKRQLVSLRGKTRSREIRPSPLNIYALGPRWFLATFFSRFSWGRGASGGRASTWWPMHTYMCTSVRERSQTHSDIHTRWICGEWENKEGKWVFIKMESRECGEMQRGTLGQWGNSGNRHPSPPHPSSYPTPYGKKKYHYYALKHSGNEAPFKANEAALAAYERTISKPPPSAAGWCVFEWIYVSISRWGGECSFIVFGSMLWSFFRALNSF